MELISVLIGIFIGSLSVITGICLKILYSRIRPYLMAFRMVKDVNFDDLYKNFTDDIKPMEEVKEDKK
jgi:hypothetical protein